MYPDKNLAEFVKQNRNSLFYSYQYPLDFSNIYITFIQSRLNTNLLLLSNPELIKEFGLDSNEIYRETEELFKISEYVKIPNSVLEKKNKLK